ncbi:TonB family protein [candidate division WOR-3 bacterium]|nr:TonB family protein [candidate division WOR-3 bacterium]
MERILKSALLTILLAVSANYGKLPDHHQGNEDSTNEKDSKDSTFLKYGNLECWVDSVLNESHLPGGYEVYQAYADPSLPFNRKPEFTYEAYTIKDEAVVRSLESDTPSADDTILEFLLAGELQAKDILTAKLPAYPDSWREAENSDSYLSLKFLVNPEGVVESNLVISRSSGSTTYDSTVVQTLTNWRFKKADSNKGNRKGFIIFRNPGSEIFRKQVVYYTIDGNELRPIKSEDTLQSGSEPVWFIIFSITGELSPEDIRHAVLSLSPDLYKINNGAPVVSVRFSVNENGDILPGTHIVTSSGSTVLDRSIMEALHAWMFCKALPYQGRRAATVTFRFF